MTPIWMTTGLLITTLLSAQAGFAAGMTYPDGVQNLLVSAKLSSNIPSMAKSVRGGINHMIFDPRQDAFVSHSAFHEYGVGFEENLGVVPENASVWWMAEWPEPVRVNTIRLNGCYPNQPQPDTAWCIETRLNGVWKTHAEGVGGWYNAGTYAWGGPSETPIELDAFRVRVFSKDENTPIGSIHFRGEEGLSWIVAYLPPLSARLTPPRWPVRAGTPITFSATPLYGTITAWAWTFGDGGTAQGQTVDHTFARSGSYDVTLHVSDGEHDVAFSQPVKVAPAIRADIAPMTKQVLAGEPVDFVGHATGGEATDYRWDFGSAEGARGRKVRHVFDKPGIYEIKLTVFDGGDSDMCPMIVRVHTADTLDRPQVFLDTDAKNEVDDQHYISYAIFSNLDVLGVNSIHHGGGQEPTNYGEILNILDLAEKSGLPEGRRPLVFHGANKRLKQPESGRWDDTIPEVTPASEAILAAARGAAPGHPVSVLPVGPCTNVASAVLQAHREGFDLAERIRIVGLIGGAESATLGTFNGANDPWSVQVAMSGGVAFLTILENPTGASLRFDKRHESNLYPNSPLGNYLKKITPNHPKALYDVTTVAMILGEWRGVRWLTEIEPVKVPRVENDYRWEHADGPTRNYVIRDIDQEAMKKDFFQTLAKAVPR